MVTWGMNIKRADVVIDPYNAVITLFVGEGFYALPYN